jgi:hypothetical protein
MKVDRSFTLLRITDVTFLFVSGSRHVSGMASGLSGFLGCLDRIAFPLDPTLAAFSFFSAVELLTHFYILYYVCMPETECNLIIFRETITFF